MSQYKQPNETEKTTFVSDKFFTIKNFAKKNRGTGTWPSSESAIWALRAKSSKNGFGDAFVTIGRRVLIDEEKFWKAIVHLQEAKNVSG